ncbi:helix-turn-helix transcriptional regulator [Corynebacterium timonense]|uniref:Proteasome accessory factor B n=1 Tax=Corynebacterium timonense TaxID=441500 RepID=A0A1H1P853_9CORY|nr:WYL domain-containing protein [Corynebacterium timonense]SDS07230.1 proteasome accessory factor B [Corynebacterium timonense]
MSADAEAIGRLTNLTFALLGAQRPRTYDWVYAHVDGYAPRTTDSFQRQLARDVDTLRRAGVPARMSHGLVWVLKDAYELPAIEFTDEEATVLGLAGDLGRGTSLGAFARSGWTKLAASGATRTFDSPALASVDNDVLRLDADTVTAVTACVRNRRRMIFDYAPSPTAATQKRTMDPWGIVALNNRAYVVGWDTDREAERAFRAMRVSNVRKATTSAYRGPDRPLQQVVEDALRGPVTDARVTIGGAVGEELAQRGQREGETITLRAVERDWLVRTVASYAPDVTRVEPKDVLDDVVTLLKANSGGER